MSSWMPGSPADGVARRARSSHSLAVVELAGPDEDPGERRVRGGDHRLGVPAVPGRQRDGVLTMSLGHGK